MADDGEPRYKDEEKPDVTEGGHDDEVGQNAQMGTSRVPFSILEHIANGSIAGRDCSHEAPCGRDGVRGC